LEGAASGRELVEEYRAVFPSENYVIADALSLPIPDASLEAVVSMSFTDVIPPRGSSEVRRVLRPGGRSISAGPLSYTFKDKAEWLTQEEMRFVIESMHQMAFESGDSVLEVPYMSHPGCLRMIAYGASLRRGDEDQETLGGHNKIVSGLNSLLTYLGGYIASSKLAP
jgi:SAM-dependent methyltransferase